MSEAKEYLKRVGLIQSPYISQERVIKHLEAFANEQVKAITVTRCCTQLPSKEVIISEAVKYQDEFLDDPHSIADEAFIEGCNFILTALQEEKVIR